MAAKPLDWDTYLNQPVRIYRNLGNGKMSIQAKTAVGWRVVGHVTDCVIRNVSFTVKEPARQRVIRDKQKNVHAWGGRRTYWTLEPYGSNSIEVIL